MSIFSVAQRAILEKSGTPSAADCVSAILSLLLSCGDGGRVRGGIVLANGWADPEGVCYIDCSVLQNMRNGFEPRPETRMECRRGSRHLDYRGLLDLGDTWSTWRERLDRNRLFNRTTRSLANLLNLQPPETCRLRSSIQPPDNRGESETSCLCRRASTTKSIW
jgi:hypothetical protein